MKLSENIWKTAKPCSVYYLSSNNSKAVQPRAVEQLTYTMEAK